MRAVADRRQQRTPRTGPVRRHIRVLYGFIVAVVVAGGAVAYAVATPAYAATSKHTSQIYTIGRQSTLTGAVIILVICIISIRRNFRRAPRIDRAAE
jgi:heme A synthase